MRDEKQEERKKMRHSSNESIRVRRKEVIGFKGGRYLEKEMKEIIRTKKWLDLKFKL